MHPNLIYHTATEAQNLDFARARGFGTLAVNGADGPLISHIPFILSQDCAEFHLVRSNPIARALSKPDAALLPAMLAVTGPDSYISPDWYGIKDQVPTWNYIAVHLRGTLERRPDDAMRDLLARQSAEYERRLAPKREWTMDKMAAEPLEKLLRMIVPFRLTIAAVDGTWKFSQNKPDAARLGAADHAEQAGFGAEVAQLAAHMRALDAQTT
ncbi:MAG: negative transcriptional regulator [Pseudooceanicola sp.]|jgi:transcriptional regulator|nr:negative transcriptional regulator [Pseudooceanicola sp.]|tara:strand:+ start:353 stop:988 length:636 start_codon:yes stop_codon:yes gene_type:complete